MSDAALSARRPLLDERRYLATLVTGDPLELRPGADVENELSAQLGARFRFSDYDRACSACFSALVRGMGDRSDYARDGFQS
jgi:hypothetical protein